MGFRENREHKRVLHANCAAMPVQLNRSMQNKGASYERHIFYGRRLFCSVLLVITMQGMLFSVFASVLRTHQEILASTIALNFLSSGVESLRLSIFHDPLARRQ
jgi:hypothetical protein